METRHTVEKKLLKTIVIVIEKRADNKFIVIFTS